MEYKAKDKAYWEKRIAEEKAQKEEAEKQARKAAKKAARKARKDAKKDEKLLQTDADQDMVNEDEGLLQSEEHEYGAKPIPKRHCYKNECFYTYAEAMEYKAKDEAYWEKRIAEEKAQKEEAEKQARRAAGKAARKARKDAKKGEDLLQTDA